MRLAPPGHAKLSQTDSLNLTFGGGEANVAISLAYFGLQAQHVTCFPQNTLGKSATQFLRRHWVNTAKVKYSGNEIGIYFLEQGAVHRSSHVIYDRSYSAFAQADPTIYDWNEILKDADWFHWTGITPALSERSAQATLDALGVAKDLGIMVSADLALRKNLWKFSEDPIGSLQQLIEKTDVIIGGNRELAAIGEGEVDEPYRDLASKVIDQFPNVKVIADKDRISKNASVNIIRGKLWNGHEEIITEPLEVTHIIDRVGTGDAFAAGLIYGLLEKATQQEALNFATAACALKHTIEGDANMVSVEEVDRLAGGDTSGRIIR